MEKKSHADCDCNRMKSHADCTKLDVENKKYNDRAPNDSFLSNPLKSYFRLSGVPLKLYTQGPHSHILMTGEGGGGGESEGFFWV